MTLGPGDNPNCHYGDHRCEEVKRDLWACTSCGEVFDYRGAAFAAARDSLVLTFWLEVEWALLPFVYWLTDRLRRGAGGREVDVKSGNRNRAACSAENPLE